MPDTDKNTQLPPLKNPRRLDIYGDTSSLMKPPSSPYKDFESEDNTLPVLKNPKKVIPDKSKPWTAEGYEPSPLKNRSLYIEPKKPSEIAKEELEETKDELSRLYEERRKLLVVPAPKAIQAAMMAKGYSPMEERENKLKEIDERIYALKTKALDVRRKADPVNKQENDEIVKSTTLTVNPDNTINLGFSNAVAKYGWNKVNRVYNETKTKQYADERQKAVSEWEKKGDTRNFYSYESIEYSEKPDMDTKQTAEAMWLAKKIIDSPEYNGKYNITAMNLDKQIVIADRFVNEYVKDTYPDLDIDARNKKAKDISKVVAATMMYDKETGNPSIQGLQMYAKANMNDLKDHLDEMNDIKQQLFELEWTWSKKSDKPPWYDKDRDKMKGKYKDFKAYQDFVEKEIRTLEGAYQFNRTLLRLPVKRGGLRDYVSAFSKGHGSLGFISGKDLASLGFDEIARNMNILGISKKVERGEELTYGEQVAIDTYASLQSALALKTKGKIFSAQSGAITMAPYIFWFGSTTPAYKVIQKASLQSLKTAAPKVIGQKLTNSLVKKSIYQLGPTAEKLLGTKSINLAEKSALWSSRAIGTAAQTVIMPNIYLSTITRRLTPDIEARFDPETTNEILTTLYSGTQEKPAEAIGKGLWEAYMETIFEHSGDYLAKAAGMPMKYLKSELGLQLPKITAFDGWMKLKGYKTIKEALEIAKKNNLGWHGIRKEYAEELATQIASNAVTGEEYGSTKEFLRQQVETFLTVATVGAAFEVGTKGYTYSRFGFIGDDVAYIRTDKDGKKTKIVIPKEVHNKLKDLFNEDLIDGAKLEDLLENYANSPNEDTKLNESQIDFILDLAIQEGRKKIKEQQVLSALEKNGVSVEEIKSETTEEDVKELKENQKTLTQQDFKRIMIMNERDMKKKYPDLYALNLLDIDGTGQMMEPTLDSLNAHRAQLNAEIKRLSEKNISGEYKVQHKEFIDSIKQELDNAIKLKNNAEIERLTTKLGMAKREPHPDLTDVITKKVTIDKYINQLSDEVGVDFAHLGPAEKHEALLGRLRKGEKLIGKVDEGFSNVGMIITLTDGSQVYGFIGKEPSKKETKDDYKRRVIGLQRSIRMKLPIELKLNKKEDWNPDDEFYESYHDQLTDEVIHIPYGDKIDIYSEGKYIGAVQVHDYNIEANLQRKIDRAIEITHNKSKDALHNLVRPDGKETALKIINDLIDKIVETLNISPNKAIPYIVDQIKYDKSLNDKQKNMIVSFIMENSDTIKESVKERIKEKKKEKKISVPGIQRKPFEVSDITETTSDNIAYTQSQKVIQKLKTFFPLWKEIAEQNNISKEKPEREFLRMAHLWNTNMITNYETFRTWLVMNSNGTDINRIVSKAIEELPMGIIVSMLNFYSNATLVPQIGIIINDVKLSKKQGGGKSISINTELLNPPEVYKELLDKFFDNINSDNKKASDIKAALLASMKSVNDRFSSENIMSSEERIKARKEQFEEDLAMLSFVTGIDKNIWRNYFSSKTNETFQLSRKEMGSWKDFETYENLLLNDSYRPYQGEFKLWRQSNLVFNLLFNKRFTPKNKDTQTWKKEFIDFFTKGIEGTEEKSDVYPNLYKLATSISEQEQIGMSGYDMKGDRFSSIQMSSNLFAVAEQEGINITILNGIQNRMTGKYKKGITSLDMNMEDIWLSQIYLFSKGKDTYLHNIGQFADKPSMYLMEVPKVMNPTDEQIGQTTNMEDFNNAVSYLYYNYATFLNSLYKKLASNYGADKPEQRIYELIRAFVYNYYVNTKKSNTLFFGNLESYDNDIVKMVKRAGSTNSPGMRPNKFIEGGVGKTFRTATINEKVISDEFGKIITKKGADGLMFFSGDYGKKMQVSLGSVFSKIGEYDILSSFKPVISYIDQFTSKRGLVKGNALNIDMFANIPGLETYSAIKKFMAKHKLDMLFLTSSAKLMASGKVIDIFNENGKFNPDIEITDEHITVMETDNLFIQQDLRHPDYPKTSKQPSQFLANMLILENGESIAANQYQMQRISIHELAQELEGEESDIAKIKYLKENVDEFSQPELFELLNKGITIDDPVYRKMMRVIISSAITNRALKIPINRITTQEIPDLDGFCEPARLTKDKKHTLEADIVCSYHGGRTHNYKYINDSEAAIKHIESHSDYYKDLYDRDGKLMKWQITERNGIIPGEPVISTRVPAHGLPSHTIGRLKARIPGNFTILDRKGQVASGSDFDGDQRYNQVFYKEKSIPTFDLAKKEGIANYNMMLALYGYNDPKNFNLLTIPLNLEEYDEFISNIKINHDPSNPIAYEDSHMNNMVGVVMKGIMTDLMTVFNLIERYNVKTKQSFYITTPTGEKEEFKTDTEFFRLNKIAEDEYGALRLHIANFLNLAFDNAADPKIEKMGLNEITAPMFIMALIADPRNSSKNYSNFDDHYKAIKKSIGKLIEYFNSDLIKDFVNESRRINGEIRGQEEDLDLIYKKLTRNAENEYDEIPVNYTGNDVKTLRALHYFALDLNDIRHFYRLTQKAPDSYTSLILAENLIKKFSDNELRILNSKMFFNKEGNLRSEFRASKDVIELSRKYIFNDAIENSVPGQQIVDYIIKLASNKNKKIGKNELDSIFSALNFAFNIRAIGINQPLSKTSEEVLSIFRELVENFPNNEFVNMLNIGIKRGETSESLIVKPEMRRQPISRIHLKRIGEDFNKLNLTQRQKDILALYTLQKYGVSLSAGGFYTLFSDEFKVELSDRFNDMATEWYYNEIDPIERLNIALWVIKANKNPNIKELSEVPYQERIMDVFTDPTIDAPVNRDALEAINNITDITEFKNIAEQFNLDSNFSDWVRTKYNIPITPERGKVKLSEHVKPLVKEVIEKIKEKEKIANKYFSDKEIPNDAESKMLVPTPQLLEAMLSYDPALEKFIYTHLKKKFPGIIAFDNRMAFYEYYMKNTSRIMPIKLEAVGHAFKNAVFIDPEAAIQEARFHEYAHIYWDHLPENHKIKERLRDFYRNDPANNLDLSSAEDLEHRIITDIGKAGTEFAEGIMESRLQEFIELIKDFWRAVKEFFGVYKDTDLITDLVYDIWTNKDQIKTTVAGTGNIIKNLVSYDANAVGFDRDKPNHTVILNDIHLPGVKTVLSAFKSNKFDPDVKMTQMINKFVEKYKETHDLREPTDDEVFEYSQDVISAWNDEKEAGIIIHALAENVFSDVDLPENFEKNFAGDAFERLKNSFIKLRNEIRLKYPNAEFITEYDLISKKYNVFGIADLIVDLGDNHVLVFDFKTTKYEYLNSDGTETDQYSKTYGFFLSPINNLQESNKMDHALQLVIYGMILEEQENANNPGEKNIVDGLYIVPVIRDIDENGIITRAKISEAVPTADEEITRALDNVIQIKYSDKYKEYANLILTKHAEIHKNLPELYKDLSKKLDDEGVAFPIKRQTLAAYSYLSSLVPNGLGSITMQDMEGLRMNGYRNIYNRLLELGYEVSDIKNCRVIRITHEEEIQELPFTPEVWLNVVREGIHKVQFISNHSAYWKTNTKVGESLVVSANPNWNPNIREYYKFIDGKEYYFYEAGINSLNIGDEVIRIYKIESRGKSRESVGLFKVKNIIKKTGTVILVDQEDENRIIPVSNVGTEVGLFKPYKIVPKNAEQIKKNKFEPYSIEKWKEKNEAHWKYSVQSAELQNSPETIAAFSKHKQLEKLLWKFYNKYNTREKLLTLLEDPEEMEVWMNDLNSVRTPHSTIGDNLFEFLGDVLTNQYFAQQIREENLKGPQAYMPATLNIYQIITNKSNVFYRGFQGINTFAYFWQPQRMIPAQYVGFHWLMSTINTYKINIHNETYDLRKETKSLFNKVNKERITYSRKEGSKEVTYWMFPTTKGLSEDEKKFLEIIYDIYYNREPNYIAVRKKNEKKGLRNPYTMAIPVSKLPATFSEIRTLFGSGRWASILYEIITDTRFDDVKLVIDKKNPDKLVTFGDLKKQFIFETATDAQKREWLGRRWKYCFRYIMFIRTGLPGGKLWDFYRKAIRIHHEGDEHNPSASKSGKRVSSLKSIAPRYETNLLMESEVKVMESIIKAYYLKKAVAPIAYMTTMYKGSSNILTYIENYTDLIVFGKNSGFKLNNPNIVRFIDRIMRLNSLRNMSWSMKTQGFNLAVGVSSDFIREPAATLKGLARFEDPRNIIKAINIIRRTGMANIVDDSKFDEAAKRAGFELRWKSESFTIDMNRFMELGYIPLEFVERVNQIPVFAGLMTKEEWDAYELSGEIKKGKENDALTTFRQRLIGNRVRDVHGDYGIENAAPFWNGHIGSLMFQFIKWGPAKVYAQFIPYHFDEAYMTRSGIIPTVRILMEKIVFNNSSEESRMIRYRDALERWPDIEKAEEYNKWINEKYKDDKDTREMMLIDMKNLKKSVQDRQLMYIQNTGDYLKMLIQAKNGQRITMKDFSDQDIRNLYSALMQLILSMLLWAIMSSMSDDTKDEKAFWSGYEKYMFKFLNRYQSDMFLMANFDRTTQAGYNENLILNKLKNPISALSIAINFIIGVFDFIPWAYNIGDNLFSKDPIRNKFWKATEGVYKTNSQYAMKGDPKWIYDVLGVVGMGQALKQMMVLRTKYLNKEYEKHLKKLGYTDDQIEQIKNILDTSLSQKEIKENAAQYMANKRISEKSAKLRSIKGPYRQMYINYLVGNEISKKTLDEAQKAALNLQLNEHFMTDGKDRDEALKDAKEWDEMYEKARSYAPEEIMRRKREAEAELKKAGYSNIINRLNKENVYPQPRNNNPVNRLSTKKNKGK